MSPTDRPTPAAEHRRLQADSREAEALGHPLAAAALRLAARALRRRQRAPDVLDRRGRDRLVETHMPRVVTLARRFSDRRVELADLVQEGSLALLEAAERYDRSRDVPFWPYAAPWVHGAIYRLAQDQRRAVRIPAAARSEIRRLRRAEDEQGGARSGTGVAADRAGIPPQRADVLLAADRSPRSLDEPVGSDDDGLVLGDLVPDPSTRDPLDQVVAAADAAQAAWLLDTLNEGQRDVLRRHFGLGRPRESLADIGRRLGVTRERARQIEVAALDNLRAVAEPAGVR
jgi:RNA polymerase sigma factor (sigma-70 family)